MGDAFYNLVWTFGAPLFLATGDPVVIGRQHVPRSGPFILAANHQSPFDIPLLMLHAGRRLDFVSIIEVFRQPVIGRFYGAMNAFPLDRSRPDAKTVRVILDRLSRGRPVCMFPEGGFRRGSESMVHTRQIRPGIGRLAAIAGVPVVPCAVIDSGTYGRVGSWLPIRSARYGIAFGSPISEKGPRKIEVLLVDAISKLYRELAVVLA